MRDAPLDTVAFAEQVLALLDEGVFNATYKFAVLAALMELCLEGTTAKGDPPQQVTTEQLARKVLELYWRQAAPFGDQAILEQNAGPAAVRGQGTSASILGLIRAIRLQYGFGPRLHAMRLAQPQAIAELEREIEWTLVKMPLPKLQRFGRDLDPFIYLIGWDDSITKTQWRDRRNRFQNQIEFVGSAASNLVRLSSLLRPLIQQKWTTKVAELNGIEVSALETFLFGTDRSALGKIARPLLELQQGRCFYCGGLVDACPHVDHFIPWCRHTDDGLDNLVVADERCNLSKGSQLAAAGHVARWIERRRDRGDQLDQIAMKERWPRDQTRSVGSVRGSYLSLREGQRLWLGRSQFESARLAELRMLLGQPFEAAG